MVINMHFSDFTQTVENLNARLIKYDQQGWLNSNEKPEKKLSKIETAIQTLQRSVFKTQELSSESKSCLQHVFTKFREFKASKDSDAKAHFEAFKQAVASASSVLRTNHEELQELRNFILENYSHPDVLEYRNLTLLGKAVQQQADEPMLLACMGISIRLRIPLDIGLRASSDRFHSNLLKGPIRERVTLASCNNYEEVRKQAELIFRARAGMAYVKTNVQVSPLSAEECNQLLSLVDDVLREGVGESK